jgi:hypothetical protein
MEYNIMQYNIIYTYMYLHTQNSPSFLPFVCHAPCLWHQQTLMIPKSVRNSNSLYKETPKISVHFLATSMGSSLNHLVNPLHFAIPVTRRKARRLRTIRVSNSNHAWAKPRAQLKRVAWIWAKQRLPSAGFSALAP